jgi:peptide deformylase
VTADPTQLRIVHYPDPTLRTRAQDIPQVNDQVRAVARRMLQLMHEAPGVGLAGPQVGLRWRLFVANPTGEPGDDRVFINPLLRDPSLQQDEAEEGCLSLPDIRAPIRRPTHVTVEATDLEGQRFALTGEGLPARIWQHEFDHLNGVLIIDRMTPIDRMANRKLIRELEKAGR